MRGDRYFEQDPWKRACECIQAQDLGALLQICVQCVCAKGEANGKRALWLQRVEQIAGAPERMEALENGSAASVVGTFGSEVIVRMFFDEAAEDFSENFEIVTEKALIVWKPNSAHQGHMLAEDRVFVEVSQQYVEDLEGKTC